jgi:hypothetical protein
VLRAWWHVRRRPGYRSAWRTWLRDWWRDRTANRGRRFGQALVLAHEVPAGVTRLHAHFLHTPASVTRYAAMIRGLPWSGSAHAKDIWTSPAWELREKLADCDWLVTCTATNRDYLGTLAPPGRVDLVYHGLDLRRFPHLACSAGTATAARPRIRCACCRSGGSSRKRAPTICWKPWRCLPASLHWTLVHVGGGPLRKPCRPRPAVSGWSRGSHGAAR